MPRNNNRSKNNNPSGRNQYSNDWMNSIKERPIAAAAVAAASVGAGGCRPGRDHDGPRGAHGLGQPAAFPGVERSDRLDARGHQDFMDFSKCHIQSVAADLRRRGVEGDEQRAGGGDTPEGEPNQVAQAEFRLHWRQCCAGFRFGHAVLLRITLLKTLADSPRPCSFPGILL